MRHFLPRTFLFATLLSLCAAAAGQTPGGAPVEDPGHAAVADQVRRPGTAPAAVGDWTMMTAGNLDKSRLAQTGHLINPAGKSLKVSGRVLGLALARGGKFVVVKTANELAVVEAEQFEVVGRLTYPVIIPGKKNSGSMHGLAVGADGTTTLVTDNAWNLYLVTVDEHGKPTLTQTINLKVNKKATAPAGVAVSRDMQMAVVALAGADSVAIVDLTHNTVRAVVPVGVCPYDVVLSTDDKTVLVSNFGGSRPAPGERTEKTLDSEMAADEGALPVRGTVSVVDIASQRAVTEIATRIHPEAMTRSPDGRLAYVADASGDGVSIIDIAQRKVVGSLNTKPQSDLPYGSLSTDVALSDDGKLLVTANAGNNAVALFNPGRPSDPPFGLISAGGYPAAVCLRGNDLFIGNIYGYFGGLQKVPLPKGKEETARLTATAQAGFHLPEILRAQARAQSGDAPRPVPERVGGPSPIRHVVYIIKENKKFDQVLGDMGRGNCEPRFCEFPRKLSPNTHALADEFVLLDNYYCNGVLSCDGHQWAVQGITSPMREKDWGNACITYDLGISPLAYAGCGFIWDHVLRHGVSFRNFGELAVVDTQKRGWRDFYTTWKDKTGKATFKNDYKIETLRRYSDMRFPGWALEIPDQVRADAFLVALDEFEKAGKMPEFVIIYLPDDHGSGAQAGQPTPRAYVADNDLAMGRVIEGLSKSRFWKDMAVFINEDDPQTGVDHVSGHRSLCLLAGPYVKRGGPVVGRFYNQDSVLHTICRILGVPPMNQLVAMAPPMADCFCDKPDFAPYACRPESTPLDETNPPPRKARSRTEARLAPLTYAIDFSVPDRIDKHADVLSRWIWSTVRGDEPFPAEYAHVHGKGLKALGLRLDERVQEEDDDR